METIIVVVAIIFSMATSLGVGSSTLAIVNFFIAIADGKIDETERRMMGTVYVVLRIAMVLLFCTLAMMTAYAVNRSGAAAFIPLLFGQWTALAVLYSNAILMTLRIMPSTFGPAIQAGSWYTLGFLGAFTSLGLTHFTYGQFLLSYISLILLAAALINGIMAYLKQRKQSAAQQ